MELIDRAKTYKLFLVEMDDDDRERVVSGVVNVGEMTVETDYEQVYGDEMYPIATFQTATSATITLTLVPGDNGTLFRIEDFSKGEE